MTLGLIYDEPTSDGDILVVSEVVTNCSTILTIVVSGSGDILAVETTTTADDDYVTISPDAGQVDTDTTFAITIGGYQSDADAYNTETTTAQISLATSGGIKVALVNFSRVHTQLDCQSVFLDPDDVCEDCI